MLPSMRRIDKVYSEGIYWVVSAMYISGYSINLIIDNTNLICYN